MKRRTFIQSGTVAATLTLGNIPVMASSKSEYSHLIEENDNILIIIQMFGGNDAINTLVPAEDDRYYSKYRIKTNLPKNNLVKLSNGNYFNKALSQGTKGGMVGLFEAGKLAVLQGIGYENPNLSHFRSTDIWLSAKVPTSDSELLTKGWLGKFSDKVLKGTLPDHPLSMNIGNSSSLLFQGEKGETAIAVENPDEFYERGKNILAGNSAVSTTDLHASEHNFILDVSEQSNKYSAVIKRAFDAGKNIEIYDDKDKLTKELKVVARLISGGLKTKIYKVSIDGFDTHANQGSADGKHFGLLSSVSKAISTFMSDLEKQKLSQKVVGMTISEFGRRPEENASIGTDHGAASVMFAFGDAINGKTYGKSLSFDNLNANKDFNHQFDYRSVYDDILFNWLKADDALVKDILGKRYGLIEKGLFEKRQIALSPEPLEKSLIYPNPAPAGFTKIRFRLKEMSKVSVGVYDLMGRKIQQMPELMMPTGLQEIPISLNVSQGQYIVNLHINDLRESHRLVVV